MSETSNSHYLFAFRNFVFVVASVTLFASCKSVSSVIASKDLKSFNLHTPDGFPEVTISLPETNSEHLIDKSAKHVLSYGVPFQKGYVRVSIKAKYEKLGWSAISGIEYKSYFCKGLNDNIGWAIYKNGDKKEARAVIPCYEEEILKIRKEKVSAGYYVNKVKAIVLTISAPNRATLDMMMNHCSSIRLQEKGKTARGQEK